MDYSLARGNIKCPRQPSYNLSFINLHTVKQAIILYPLKRVGGSCAGYMVLVEQGYVGSVVQDIWLTS